MKITKRVTAIVLTILVFITNFNFLAVEASYKLPFEPNSQSVYLVNTDTNTVVYEKDAHKKLSPASLTKIMTAIIALETVKDLEGTKIKAPAYLYDEFYQLNVSNADIRQGEEVRMIDLIYAMMLPSACEASSIIADYLGSGNITEFVEMMNKKAKEIGAKDTVFKNPHGLHNEAQITTAYDMYLITKYALSIPIFEKIATTSSYQMPATNKHSQPYLITHTNLMMSKVRGGDIYYEFVKGIKTGSLPEVGKNLVSMASKDGYNYLLVTLGAPAVDDKGAPLSVNGAFADAKNLYKWAFSSFKQTTIVQEDEVVGETPVKLSSDQDYVTLTAKDSITALLPTDSDVTTIQKIKTFDKNVRAPIKKGDVLGKMDLKLNDNIIASVDLVASQDIDRSIWLYSFDVVKRFLSNILVKILLGILGLLIIMFAVMAARYRKISRIRAARARNMQRKHK